MQKIIKRYNHKLSQDLIKKALTETEDWYSEEVKQSSIEFLNWLTSK